MNLAKFQRLKNKAFRDAFVSAHIDQGLAFQIRALRENRGWDQKTLARKIGLRSQSAIARMEDPSYGKLSISSVKRLGKVFDVGVLVKFVPYSRMLTETEDLSQNALAAKGFTEEEHDLTLAVSKLSTYKIFSPAFKGASIKREEVFKNNTDYLRSEVASKMNDKESSYA